MRTSRPNYRPTSNKPSDRLKFKRCGAELFQQHAPDVAAVYGSYLDVFLLQGIFKTLGIPWPDSWAIKLERLRPDHPLIHEEDGHYSGLEALTEKQFYQYRDYQKSLAPPGKRGPKPNKKRAKPRRPGPRSIDPMLALRASEMANKGHDWTEIAAQLWPDERYRNKKERDKLYKKVDRAIERGNILIQQKKDDAHI
jgi:hypothetical protein